MSDLENRELVTEYNVFCQNVKYYRKLNHFTQEILAEKSDLSISYIKQIESGIEFKNVSLTTMLKIAKALNIHVHDLFKEKKG